MLTLQIQPCNWLLYSEASDQGMIVCALDSGHACCVGILCLLDALIRRELPIGLDAPDADAPDAYYQFPIAMFSGCYYNLINNQ